MNLLDPRFKYTPSMSTDIVKTWKRHGFKVTTEAERQRRMRGQAAASTRSASVTSLNSAKRKLRALSLATPKVAEGGKTS
jgi:hypothetical protein